MKILIILLIGSVYCRSYSYFSQCDSNWGSDKLGTSSNTICNAGALVSSVSMMINTYGIKVNTQTTNPKSLNIWLKGNGGYVAGDLFVWNSINQLGFEFQGHCTPYAAKFQFDSGNHVFLNVRDGTHWVLMTGYNASNKFQVHDSAYKVSEYDLSEIVNASYYIHNKRLYFYSQIMQLK